MIFQEDKDLIVDILNSYRCFGIEYIKEFDYKNLRDKKVHIELPEELSKLTDFIEHCSLCELSKLTEKKNIGFGNPQSKIYLVSDSLNLKDRNIVNLLNDILGTLGLSFQDIYITNIIKCAFDLEKDTKEKFCHICKDYTLQQIKIMEPSVILAFGDSWKYFLDLEDDDSIYFGRKYLYKEIPFFPLYDLEFLYKNPSYYNDMKQYLSKIKRFIQGD